MKHNSNIFLFDNDLTLKGYKKSSNCFVNENTKENCLNKITEAVKRNHLDEIGIDFNKPWEDFELDNKNYQIEFLFVGELLTPIYGFISDDDVGINIYRESRFGIDMFKSEKILNLTFIIEK